MSSHSARDQQSKPAAEWKAMNPWIVRRGFAAGFQQMLIFGSRLYGFEAMLVDSQARDPGLEGLPRDPKLRRGAKRPGNAAAAFLQRSFDHFHLLDGIQTSKVPERDFHAGFTECFVLQPRFHPPRRVRHRTGLRPSQ